MITRLIPSTGEALPVLGIGTWQSFDVSPSQTAPVKAVLRQLHEAGGRLIDSSPMYGRAETIIGEVTSTMKEGDDFFYATKVWTTGAASGQQQIAESYRRMNREVMDLIQVHNLVDWTTHLPYLRQLKNEGRLRYIGITHYQNSSHAALAEVIRKVPLDFVQFNYSLFDRQAEKELLPLCQDKGIATLINRPFGEGAHFRQVANQPIPPWAIEAGLETWPKLILHYILSHPAVTCVIPATSNPLHAKENYDLNDNLPDALLRQQLAQLANRIAHH